MRVLKWLFQPVYLLLIIVIVALYVNREAIFSDEVAESLEAEALVGKVDALVERLRADAQYQAPNNEVNEDVAEVISLPESSPAAPVVEEPSPVTEQPNTIAEKSAPAAEGLDPVAEESVPVTEELAPVTEIAPVESSDAQPITPEDEVVEVIEEEEAPEVVAVAPVVTQSPPEPPAEETAAPVASPLATWRAARAAVWQGDLNGAVAQYRQLIAQQPNNYDAYGEMGNVLLAQSEVSAAVEAYVAAARLIHQSGNQQMARRLVGVVATLDEAQGRALYNEFNQ